MIGVNGSKRCFSPRGNPVAFLKKKHPTDSNDRSRVIVINNIQDLRAHVTIDKPAQESEKEWYLSHTLSPGVRMKRSCM